MIEPVIISLIIAGSGLVLTAIFNSKNFNRNTQNDKITDHERAVKTEAKLDSISDSIKDLKKDTSSDFSDLKKSVSNDIASIRQSLDNISHASSKVQIRQEKLESRIDHQERRLQAVERRVERRK